MIDKDKLKYYRELNGYTLGSLAWKTKCAKVKLEAYEEGTSEIDFAFLNKLADLYGISVEDFYYDEEESFGWEWILLLGVFAILGFFIGFYKNNIPLMFLAPINNLSLVYAIRKIYLSRESDPINSNLELPKSLFGKCLNDLSLIERINIYFYEAVIIACAFTLLILMFYLLSFNFFLLEIDFVGIESVNTGIICASMCLLLGFISFIIEWGFGELLLKKYNEEE